MFQDKYEKIFAIPGWLAREMLVTLDSLLDFQKQKKVSGHHLEIGVYRGRLAALMNLHRARKEQLFLVDPVMPKDEIKGYLADTGADMENIHYLDIFSQQLPAVQGWASLASTMRFIHIDGEHTRVAVLHDLRAAEPLLRDNGIIVVDDFFNAQYPQVTQGVFEYCAANTDRIVLLMHGFNKVILCRPKYYAFYQSWLTEKLTQDLWAEGHEATLSKTSTIMDSSLYAISHYKGNDGHGNAREKSRFLGCDRGFEAIVNLIAKK